MHEYETIFRHLKPNVSPRKCLRPTYSTMPFQSDQMSMRKHKLRRETQKSKTANEPEGGRWHVNHTVEHKREGQRIGLDIFQVMVTNYVPKRGLANAYTCIC